MNPYDKVTIAPLVLDGKPWYWVVSRAQPSGYADSFKCTVQHNVMGYWLGGELQTVFRHRGVTHPCWLLEVRTPTESEVRGYVERSTVRSYRGDLAAVTVKEVVDPAGDLD